jgi:hypothetical protein
MMDQGNNANRPSVLNNVSETQMRELESQFEQQDTEGWERLREEYGWTVEDAEEVWNWFGIRPTGQR